MKRKRIREGLSHKRKANLIIISEEKDDDE
jgi:hypothetical protein